MRFGASSLYDINGGSSANETYNVLSQRNTVIAAQSVLHNLTQVMIYRNFIRLK